MSVFYNELQEHPSALEDTLDAYYKTPRNILRDIGIFWKRGKFRRVLFTGMGSSRYAGIVAAHYLMEHGIPAFVEETGELLNYDVPGVFEKDTLLVLVSQSGETIEITRLMKKIPTSVKYIGVTNTPNSTLTKSAHYCLLTHAGKETASASKTYTATIAGLLLVAGQLSNTLKEIRGYLYAMVKHEKDFLNHWKKKLSSTGKFIKNAQFINLIARGYCYGSALQSSLIIKEATKTYAEGILAGTFRHGPIEVVNPNFRAIVFAPQGKTTSLMLRMAEDIAALHGKVLLITNSPQPPKHKNILTLSLPDCPEFTFPLLDILVIELLCCQIADLKKITAGELERITKVTLIE